MAPDVAAPRGLQLVTPGLVTTRGLKTLRMAVAMGTECKEPSIASHRGIVGVATNTIVGETDDPLS